MTFNWKEWHHGYLGIILIVAAFIWDWPVVGALGAFILLDECIQILTGRQYGGLLHNLYIKTLWKVGFIRKFNMWLDKLFGKKL